VDDIAMLLDRAVIAALDATEAPPATLIRYRAHRRSRSRIVASATLIVVMTVGGVIGLASAGRASETTGNVATASSVAQPASGQLAP
jgi:hypothetical protein